MSHPNFAVFGRSFYCTGDCHLLASMLNWGGVTRIPAGFVVGMYIYIYIGLVRWGELGVRASCQWVCGPW